MKPPYGLFKSWIYSSKYSIHIEINLKWLATMPEVWFYKYLCTYFFIFGSLWDGAMAQRVYCREIVRDYCQGQQMAKKKFRNESYYKDIHTKYYKHLNKAAQHWV